MLEPGGATTGAASRGDALITELLGDRAAEIDEFDRVQLAHVLHVCRESPTLSAAGRRLFAASRRRRSAINDADRLRKYLAKHELDLASGIRPRAQLARLAAAHDSFLVCREKLSLLSTNP